MQAEKFVHSFHTQSTGHGGFGQQAGILHVLVSLALPLHRAPPLTCATATVRVRPCVPFPPHETEQGLKSAQGAQAQSTGQVCALQLWTSVLSPVQFAPPGLGILMMLRLRFCWPPAQGLEQLPKSDQEPHMQSWRHVFDSQDSVSEAGPVQF